MSVWQNHDALEPSNVRCDGTWVLAYEKGPRQPGEAAFDHIDYGAIAVRRSILAEQPEGVAWGFDVLQRDLARKRRLRAYVAHDRFFEIGSPEGLAALNGQLKT
jgi:NDP-sugar pyrophosphorylase family protein